MLDFLRRLAPPELRASAAARPVLPPRFATPAGAAAALTDALDDGRAPAGFEPSVASPPRGHAAQGASARARLPERGPADAVDGAAAARQLDLQRESVVAMPSAAWRSAPTPPPEARARDADQPTAAPSAASRTVAAPRGADSSAHLVPMAIRPDAAFAPPSEAQARPAAMNPPPAGTPVAQARPSADPASLPARRGPANPAPVIHVTIDRIDLRAPTAPPRPASVARQRAAAPSVSLADYLRGSTVPRRGGGS